MDQTIETAPGRSPGRRGWKTAGLLALTLVVCAPPLFVGLKTADTTFHMEVITFLSSQETWVRQLEGERDAWLVPSWNGRQRIVKPPFAIWMNMLAWTGLDPSSAAPEQLVLRARLASGLTVLAGLAALFLLGRLLGDDRTAVLATLAAGTMVLFLRQARLASYDTYLMSWLTISVAAGVWAVRLAEVNGRPALRRFAWALSGVAMACAFMAKGPLALPLMAGPLALVAVLPRSSRRRNVLGLLGAVALGLALVAPWYIYVLRSVPGAAEVLLDEFRAEQHDTQPPWYYLCVFYLAFPWTLWLAGAMRNPFAAADPDARARRRPAWLWFAWIIFFMSLSTSKHQRYIVPILPAAGLLVAQCFVRSGTGLPPRGRLLRAAVWTHWTLLLAGSLAFAALIFQPQMIAAGWMERPEFEGLHPAALALTSAVLLGIAVVGLRAHLRGKTFRAGLVTGGWMIVAATAGFYGYVRSHHGRYADRADVARVNAVAGDATVYYLLPEGSLVYREEPDQKFIFYARRVTPQVTPAGLAALAGRGGRACVIARDDPAVDELMRGAGFEPVLDLMDGSTARRLYRAPGS